MSSPADHLTDLLPEAGLELMLVTNLVNVRYLTGYTGSNGLALIGPATRTFFTDFRYVEQAAKEVDSSFERRRALEDLLDAVDDGLGGGELRLGFEEEYLSVRQYARLRSRLSDRIELVGVSGLVEGLRAVKQPHELERIRVATELADRALARLLEQGLAGRTERQLAAVLEQTMRELGASRPSFDSIVAAGPRGALPHAAPQDIPVGRGEMVVIDWGAVVEGYNSDCTRTVAVGEPATEARDVYQLVLEAQLAGVRAVKAGADGREVDAVARAVIDGGGHGEHYGHGLGHGVGLEVHEGPRLSQRSQDTLESGNVVSVEPGIYLPGRFGVRIEDLVAVTEGGCEILTGIAKDLTVVE